MEPLAKVIVYPILGIVYVTLPCLSRPHFSLASFIPSFPCTVFYLLPILKQVPFEFYVQYVFLQFAAMAAAAGSRSFVNFIFDLFDKLDKKFDISSNGYVLTLVSSFTVLILILPCSVMMASTIFAVGSPIPIVVLVIVPTMLLLSTECLVYLLSVFSYLVTRAVVKVIIVGLKNRRACQFLSALAAVVLGVTKAKVFAAIPISVGIFLSVPDLEPDPWVDFKLQFAKFLEANMDAKSVNAFLHSKSFKLVSCNELMPELGPDRPITAAASFVLQQSFSPEDQRFNVEGEYKIGLGSITTSMRGDVIDVQIFTPFSGVKKRTIANTARSRYNLDMSARFWRNHPQVGILNKAFERGKVYKEGQLHCIGVDKWIKLCGSEEYVFKEHIDELETM